MRLLQGNSVGGQLTLALIAEARPPLAAVAVEVAATVSGAAGGRGSWGRRGRGRVRCPAQVTHAGEVRGATAYTMTAVLQAPEGPWKGWGKSWAGPESPRQPLAPPLHPIISMATPTQAIACSTVLDYIAGSVSKVTPSHVVTPVSIVTTRHYW